MLPIWCILVRRLLSPFGRKVLAPPPSFFHLCCLTCLSALLFRKAHFFLFQFTWDLHISAEALETEPGLNSWMPFFICTHHADIWLCHKKTWKFPLSIKHKGLTQFLPLSHSTKQLTSPSPPSLPCLTSPWHLMMKRQMFYAPRNWLRRAWPQLKPHMLLPHPFTIAMGVYVTTTVLLE